MDRGSESGPMDRGRGQNRVRGIESGCGKQYSIQLSTQKSTLNHTKEVCSACGPVDAYTAIEGGLVGGGGRSLDSGVIWTGPTDPLRPPSPCCGWVIIRASRPISPLHRHDTRGIATSFLFCFYSIISITARRAPRSIGPAGCDDLGALLR